MGRRKPGKPRRERLPDVGVIEVDPPGLLGSILGGERVPVVVENAGTVLRRVARLQAQRERLDLEIRAEVAAARLAGASWADVGSVLGVSAGAARMRHSRDDE